MSGQASQGIPPDDPDFIYLGVDRKKVLEEAPPYDGKKNCWVPDEKEGYASAEIESTKGEIVQVITTEKRENRDVKKDDIQQMNPPKFYMYEDMANLTYLNEASILCNLRTRYVKMLIYTYSGLFCIAINPYRRLPVYKMSVVQKYRGKRRAEMPPHLYSIADNAYANMVQDRENQSMLITGESGAGKTENTKKVIGYFAMVAAMQQAAAAGMKVEDLLTQIKTTEKQITLEEQIVQTNPPLEAWGNAKTVRNNNSSRFGKFIRIHFAPNGKIAGADIETYLLEKSRVTYQMPGVERNYHIFYWLLTEKYPDYAEKLLVQCDPGLYHFINQGCLEVDGIDDPEEMKNCDEAFDMLGFTFDEKFSMYKCTASVLHCGELKFKQRPREEQAEADGTTEAEKVAHLLGVNCNDFMKALLQPKVKVGSEMVTKGQNLDQVNFAVRALSKCLYSKMFSWLVARVNKTLDTKNKRQFYIGVLDIAGFEIFEFNTLEQLCINYTNERLQQFFNHHMFVLEQEEYKKEGIEWTFIDFGMDLQDTIDLIEKPMGILSILEEECMFPKATDKSFLTKLYENHLGKSPAFAKPRIAKNVRFERHFELGHYAGSVGYNIDGWLNKNKDPINESVIQVLGSSKEKLVAALFASDDLEGTTKKRKKGSSYQTISATHREQLNKLMKNLYTTHPHFVRCIIPNECKQSGLIDAALVLHQLRCNGVLEGIRICRKGFPNRMLYSEFKQRYSILAPNVVPQGFVDGKLVTEKVLDALPLNKEDFRLGNTKVFFRAGVLGTLEDWRDARLAKIVTLFQAHIRGYILRKSYQKLCDQRVALSIIQRNIRKWLGLRNWNWWKLYTRVKPLLSMARAEDEMKKKEEEYEKCKVELEKVNGIKKQLEEQNVVLLQQKNDLFLQLQTEQDTLSECEDKIVTLVNQKAEYESQIKEYEERLSEEENNAEVLENDKRKLEDKCESLKGNIENLELHIQKVEEEKKAKDNQIRTLNDEMARQDESIAKLNKDKKNLDETLRKTQDDLQAEEDKCNHLNKLKQKLESQLDDVTDNLEREKKSRADVEKAKRKIESDLKLTQETVEELERIKHDLDENVRRKESEINNLNARLEDEQSLVAQLQKKIKELMARIEELEEELEAERQARAKVEKQRNALQMELDELGERLDEAGGATQAQIEQNKKREAELQHMKRDLEEQALQHEAAIIIQINITIEQNKKREAELQHMKRDLEEQALQHEAAITSLKKKSQDALNELSDQLDQLSKVKSKAEKERNSLKSELDDLQSQYDHVQKGKGQAEKLAKTLENQLTEMNSKLDNQARTTHDADATQMRLQQENAEVGRQLEEAESQLGQLQKQKQGLAKQLEEVKANLEEEARQRAKFQSESRNLQADLDQLRDQLEEEIEGRAEVQRLLAKANTEMQMWKSKFESGEGGVRSEEMEDMKRKLHAKLQEAEAQLEQALSRANGLEKAKQRLNGEIEDLMIEVDRAQALANQADKKQRHFDKTIDEWKQKVADLEAELSKSNAEGRASAAEVYKVKAQLEETNESIEALRRENKNLSDEIHDLTDQLSDGGRSTHELEKIRRRLEMEKEELQAALEEAETALEQEEVKVQRAQLEISAIKQEIDRRIAEKDEEFETTRKNHQRALDSMQASLEAEVRGKAEAMRMKKKLESDINELEVALDGANRGRAEAERNIKKIHQQILELQMALEEERRGREEARNLYQTAERRANVLAGEIEELRTQLESAERARKSAESELYEASDRVSELTAQVTVLNSAKRKLETEVQSMASDLEEQAHELKISDENAKKALADAARLAEDLRLSQDHAASIERSRKSIEGQMKELQIRLDEAEANSMKGGKRMLQKMEQRVRELEAELDNEQRRHAETTKNMCKQDRRLKELVFTADEDRKAHEKHQEIIDKLQQKIKVYKRQVEDAEEIASINLAKYRKVQCELEEAEERADSCENTLAKLRAKNRSSVSAQRATGGAHARVQASPGRGANLKITMTETSHRTHSSSQ